jgi:hypothetical protein
LSDGGGGDLSEVAGRGGTRSAEGLDGGRPKGWWREVRDRSERGSVVGRSSGSQLAGQRRAGGSCQWWLGDGLHSGVVVAKCGGKRVAPQGGAPFIAGRGGWQRRREPRPGQWWR